MPSTGQLIVGMLISILSATLPTPCFASDQPATPAHLSVPETDVSFPLETIPADDQAEINSRLASLERELRDLSDSVQLQSQLPGPAEDDKGIDIGGAVRFQYSVEDYAAGNSPRGGDIDFDIFRLDFNGELGGVLLSAQYRWFQYMNVIHHGWVGYRCSDQWQVQAGIARVPFGNLDFNSNSYFFSTNYYVGLEDDYDAGIKIVGTSDHHDLRLAFFKTDEMGGVDGYVDNRSDRYSYDIVGIRQGGEGTFDPPAFPVAENNTVCMRYAYKFPCLEIGGSWLYGGLYGPVSSAGDRWAYAIHGMATFGQCLVQLQFTDYRYNSADDTGLMVVGAYSFFDTIPAAAKIYTANAAYNLPVDFGPITSLKFYNDFNVMTDKSGGLRENSYMNITGVAVAAGGLYTYFDLISARNHPFIGGSLGSDSGNWNTRFNVNVGFYF